MQERRVGAPLTGAPGHRVLALAVAAVIVAADQLTKWWALGELADGPIDLLGPVQLRLTRNTGGAFGLGAGYAPLLAAAALVVVIVLARAGGVTRHRASAVALALVLGGAIGNLADRVARTEGGFLDGAVVDFVDLRWWPVFNVADMAIVSGGILLVISSRHADADGDPGRAGG